MFARVCAYVEHQRFLRLVNLHFLPVHTHCCIVRGRGCVESLRWRGGAVTRKGRVRTEGESLMIVSHTTTWLSTLGFVSYSAVTYTKSCFTFQFHTERRSASMPSVRTACREA